jgi:hypothetical protein
MKSLLESSLYLLVYLQRGAGVFKVSHDCCHVPKFVPFPPWDWNIGGLFLFLYFIIQCFPV